MEANEATAKIMQANWQRVQEQVAEACIKVAREPSEVRIVGVSKYVGPELAAQLIDAGCRDLGENRPQHLWELHDYSAARNVNKAALAEVTWHMIGHLQRNKLRRTLPMIGCLHSLDSLKLATAVSAEAVLIGKRLPVLIEVNITNDREKTGLSPEQLPSLLEQLDCLPLLQVQGLMAMSSLGADANQARREFEQVRDLRDRLQTLVGQLRLGQLSMGQLSMGMSGDFAEAIAAGATIVRIGTHLWEGIL